MFQVQTLEVFLNIVATLAQSYVMVRRLEDCEIVLYVDVNGILDASVWCMDVFMLLYIND